MDNSLLAATRQATEKAGAPRKYEYWQHYNNGSHGGSYDMTLDTVVYEALGGHRHNLWQMTKTIRPLDH
jgi:hypothetical protein